jgi:hypothetical protein
MATGKTTQITLENEFQHNHVVSADRKLMASDSVQFDINGNMVKDELVIANADGQKLKAIPWEKGWFAIAGWLDDQRLVINIANMNPLESHAKKAPTLLVLNPFTGGRQALPPNFPNIYTLPPIPEWDYWGITMYDPTLTRVAYLTDQYEIAVWDMQKGKSMGSSPAPYKMGSYGAMPRWSPDGSQFVVEGWVPGQSFSELYLVSRDGQVEKLTNLNAAEKPRYYDNARLLNTSWSPDGRYIAAWLDTPSLGDQHEMELAIVDSETGQVINYCLRVMYGGEDFVGERPPMPIWSPDGKQLVVVDWYEKDHRRVILVDPGQGFAAQIASDMQPAGWMLAP